MKLGKNSRPTEKKAQKTQAEKAENKAKLSHHEEYGPAVVTFLLHCSLLGSPRDAHVP